MVEAIISGQTLHLEMFGWSWLLCSRRKLDIPLQAIKQAYAGPQGLPKFRWTDLRLMGTGVPRRIAAGTYSMGQPRQRVFLDLRSSSTNVLILELENYRYDRVMVEVADVNAALRLFQAPGESRAGDW